MRRRASAPADAARGSRWRRAGVLVSLRGEPGAAARRGRGAGAVRPDWATRRCRRTRARCCWRAAFRRCIGAELEANAPLRGEVARVRRVGAPGARRVRRAAVSVRRSWTGTRCAACCRRVRDDRPAGAGLPRGGARRRATPWLAAGERVRGHEFHYTQVEPAGAVGDAGPAWTLELSARGSERTEGFARGGVQASYLHVHWAAHPELASRFAQAARVGARAGAHAAA